MTHVPRGRWALAALSLVLASPLASQATPQRHVTADWPLANGTIVIWSVDSGGARRVRLDVRALTVDTVLGFRRGGTFTLPTARVPSVTLEVEAAMDQLARGESVPASTWEYPTGTVRAVTIQCLATGCALTITNRTRAGVTRAGSWTTARLSVGLMRDLARALRDAAVHETGVVVVPR